jgi:hypothetical protein
MGHYLGGAPLVTQERNILSDVPWIVPGQQWNRTRWSPADSVVPLLAGTRGCLAMYALDAELGIARCVVGAWPCTRWARNCASLRSQYVRMVPRRDHGAYGNNGLNGLFSEKIACVGFYVNHFLGKW